MTLSSIEKYTRKESLRSKVYVKFRDNLLYVQKVIKIAVFTVNVSILHYNKIQCEYENISGITHLYYLTHILILNENFNIILNLWYLAWSRRYTYFSLSSLVLWPDRANLKITLTLLWTKRQNKKDWFIGTLQRPQRESVSMLELREMYTELKQRTKNCPEWRVSVLRGIPWHGGRSWTIEMVISKHEGSRNKTAERYTS